MGRSRKRKPHSVPILDAMFMENIFDTVLGENVCEGESLIAREAGAHFIPARHGIAFKLAAIPAA